MAKRDRNPGNKKRRRNIAAKKSGSPVRRLLKRASVLGNYGRPGKASQLVEAAFVTLSKEKDKTHVR